MCNKRSDGCDLSQTPLEFLAKVVRILAVRTCATPVPTHLSSLTSRKETPTLRGVMLILIDA